MFKGKIRGAVILHYWHLTYSPTLVDAEYETRMPGTPLIGRANDKVKQFEIDSNKDQRQHITYTAVLFLMADWLSMDQIHISLLQRSPRMNMNLS